MKGSSTKLSVILLVAVIGAIFLNKYVTKDWLNFYPKSFMSLGGYLFTEVEDFSGFVKRVGKFNRLASENDKLKQIQETALSLKARIDYLENENDFLRHAANISQKFNYPVVYAGIFNLNLSPSGYNVLLNKGSLDGISEDDVVITAEGVLVGKIQKVSQKFSRILFISDPEFKITARVLNSNTAGIARGALNEGMFLDFVVQNDEIREGDVLISTGNDLFPPALVLGSVEHIEANAAQMFKKVRIRPAIKDIQLGRVLIIKIR